MPAGTESRKSAGSWREDMGMESKVRDGALTMVGIADAAEDGGGEICCLLATGEEEPECPTTPPGIETALVLR